MAAEARRGAAAAAAAACRGAAAEARRGVAAAAAARRGAAVIRRGVTVVAAVAAVVAHRGAEEASRRFAVEDCVLPLLLRRLGTACSFALLLRLLGRSDAPPRSSLWDAQGQRRRGARSSHPRRYFAAVALVPSRARLQSFRNAEGESTPLDELTRGEVAGPPGREVL